jgi:hypothetical protein
MLVGLNENSFPHGYGCVDCMKGGKMISAAHPARLHMLVQTSMPCPGASLARNVCYGYASARWCSARARLAIGRFYPGWVITRHNKS